MARLADFCVIGGGIIGLNISRELRRRFPSARVLLLEKEKTLCEHGSGRNSGVIHAGFYYHADSLKAKFTRDGNRALTRFCQERKLKINKCGKLVVAQSEQELVGLEELLRRGQKNGVELHKVTATEAEEIEPRVLTHEYAIWSPTTSSADPKQVGEAMVEDAKRLGVDILANTRFHGLVSSPDSNSPHVLSTSSGTIEAKHLVNAAGLYADHVANAFGFGKQYIMLPFKGLYLYCKPEFHLRTLIYPVPDLIHPFLGVHFTVNADNHVKIGPTAIPAFWRENYQFSNVKWKELLEIIGWELGLFFKSDFNFRRLALTEFKKYHKPNLVSAAARLVRGFNAQDVTTYGRPGIRAQLLNIHTRKLEMDFIIEGDNRSTHILNCVSPGWTCSIPFSAHVCDIIEKKTS